MGMISVADYLSKALERSGLTQRELAEAVGYTKPNVISMMKLGQIKIPIEKVPALAKATGTDPAVFLSIAMQEYSPQVWKALEATFGMSLTDREKEWVRFLRMADPEGSIDLNSSLAERISKALSEDDVA